MGMYCKNCGDEDSVEAKGELFVCSKCGTEYTKAEMQKIFSEYIFDMIGEIENSVNTIMEIRQRYHHQVRLISCMMKSLIYTTVQIIIVLLKSVMSFFN